MRSLSAGAVERQAAAVARRQGREVKLVECCGCCCPLTTVTNFAPFARSCEHEGMGRRRIWGVGKELSYERGHDVLQHRTDNGVSQ